MAKIQQPGVEGAIRYLIRTVAAELRKALPADRPVYVRRLQIRKDHIADCGLTTDKKAYIIRISKGLRCFHCIVECLIHEWAHVLAWGQEKNDHGRLWGAAYSRCYRVIRDRKDPDSG